MSCLRLLATAFVSFAALAACAGTQATTPRSRVAKDLGCTTEGTAVEELAKVPGENAARWQVTGCGRTAVYLCTTPVRDCWREGEVGPPTASPPTASPPTASPPTASPPTAK